MLDNCEICGDIIHESTDHPFLPKITEVNNNIKDLDEGGQGSGRSPEGGSDNGAGSPGPLISFEPSSVPGSLAPTSIGAKRYLEALKVQLMDAKLNCPCQKKH